jgi:hypothetical protein
MSTQMGIRGGRAVDRRIRVNMVAVRNGQTQGGEGEHYATLVSCAYEKTQAGGDNE